MTLTLAVETSSARYGIALARDGELLAARTRDRTEAGFPGLGAAVAEEFAGHGVTAADVGRLAVDVGPGNLGSVRVGVAYVNGLAFARSITIVGVDSLSLLAHGVSGVADGRPVLALRRSAAGRVCAGWFVPGDEPVTRIGPPATVLPELVAGATEIAVAGALAERVPDLLPGVRVVPTGLVDPRVEDLVAVASRNVDAASTTVSPLTDEIDAFTGVRDTRRPTPGGGDGT